MEFDDICRAYLAELSRTLESGSRTGQATSELSYRTPLDTFFGDLCDYFGGGIDKIHEPSNEGEVGRPDWRFSDSGHLGVYGYIEAKGIDLTNEINYSTYQDQIQRYLSLGQDVILTDGLDFLKWSPKDAFPTSVKLVDKPIQGPRLPGASPNPRLEVLLRDFFDEAQRHPRSEDEIIRKAAQHATQISTGARKLAGLLPDQARDEKERKTIERLVDLRKLLEEHHDPTMRSPKIFGDFVAQVLTFGLLYPHRVGASEDRTAPDTYEYLHKFWDVDDEGRMRPFKALVELLDEELNEGNLGEVGTWYDDFRLYLSYVELDEEQRTTPDYHGLYEDFLDEFDSEQRYDFGAFYTPKEIASFSTGLVEAITNTHFSNTSLYDNGNKLIDPCSGTGSFLEALVLATPDDKEPEIAGFEILPAPYALSHYRMSMIGGTSGYPSGVSVVLTNTLMDQLAVSEDEISEEGSIVREEQKEARRLSNPPLLLVIGNPPSKTSELEDRNSGENFSEIEDMLDDFRPPEFERVGRSNIQKQVRNTFMKFLRWTCDRIERSPRGIFSFVLPSSFTTGVSYVYARKWLFDNFDRIWILDIDRDGRTGEETHSMFGTRQGRTIVVGLNKTENGGEESASVQHASIVGKSVEDKKEFLSKNRDDEEHTSLFEAIEVQSPRYEMVQGVSYPEDLWTSYWPVKPGNQVGQHIFDRHCSAVKCAPTHFLVHADDAMLKRRTGELAEPENSFSKVNQEWFDGMSRPPSEEKRTDTVRSALSEAHGDWEDSALDYSYRPFVTCRAVITDKIMSALGDIENSGTRYRPEIGSAFREDDTIGIAVAPSPPRLGDNLHRLASFCWNLPDNDMAKRGSARVLCNQFPEEKSGNDWDSTPIDNVNESFIGKLKKSYGESISKNEVVYYTYAVLSSPFYLDAFEGALFRNQVNPRIPIPKDKNVFDNIVEKGKEIALLEKKEDTPQGRLEGKYLNQSDSFESPFKLKNPQYYNEYNKGDEIIVLKNDNSGDMELEIKNVPEEVGEYEISGNTTIYEWLKVYSFPYLRRDFRKEDYLSLLSTLERLEKQIQILNSLSQIQNLVDGSEELIDCPTTVG